MDGRGSWRDNVFVERLWRSVKYEEVYLRAYDSVAEARSSIGSYLAFYNRKRPHSSLDGTHAGPSLFPRPGVGGGRVMFAAAVGHRSGRATPSLRDAPQRQSMEIVGRETIYRNRNAVQTNPATSLIGYEAKVAAYIFVLSALRLVLVRERLATATLLFAAATYFHFLVWRASGSWPGWRSGWSTPRGACGTWPRRCRYTCSDHAAVRHDRLVPVRRPFRRAGDGRAATRRDLFDHP